MHLTESILLVLLPLFAAAIPIEETSRSVKVPLSKRSLLTNPDGTVNLLRLRSHVSRTTEKVARGLYNYRDNTGVPHQSLSGSSRHTKRDTGVISLSNQDQTLWFGAISVGNPGKSFVVDFDTGSSDLFLPGPECGPNCEGHQIYDPSASTSAQNTGRTFSLTYGDGTAVSGDQYTDRVAVGGLEASGQTLGVAKSYSDHLSLQNFPADGIMGLAFPQISVFAGDPTFQTLVAQGALDEAAFSFKLTSGDSSLFIGGADKNLFTGGFSYAPVTIEGFWQVDQDQVLVNRQRVLGTTSVIIDTGSSLILGTRNTVKQVYDAIPGSASADDTAGAGFFTIPCDNIPTIALSYGGRDFTISPSIFNQGALSEGSDLCVGGIAAYATNDPGDFWTVGDVFLQNVYTTFEADNKRVGFADLA